MKHLVRDLIGPLEPSVGHVITLLATLILLAVPAPAAAAAASCLNGFAAISIGNPEISQARLADRNGDGTACRMIVQGRDGIRSTVLLDNFIGDPNTFPVALCTTPFRPRTSAPL